MRRVFVVALAVAVVLTASLSVALASPSHAPGPSMQSGVQPFATDTIVPTDSGGGPTFEFAPGAAVYFTANDPTDANVTVHINDQNASRDALSNPVASWTVALTAGVYESWTHDIYYQIPVNLKLGGVWNITISGTTAGFDSTEFHVYTYVAESQASPDALLPGEPGSLYYDLVWAVNGAADTTVTTLTITATYLDAATGTLQPLPGFPATLNSPTALSSVAYTAPGTASTAADGGILFHLYANTTGGPYPNSAESTTFVGVGQLELEPITIAPCPSCAAQTNFLTGSPAYVSITGFIESQLGFSAPAAGVHASLIFFANGAPVSSSQIPGAPPASLTLNSVGQAAVFFWVDAPPFSTKASNAVNVTLSDPWDASANTTSGETNFTTTAAVPGAPAVSILFQYSHYYSGETATAEWQLANYTSSGPSAGWTVGQWLAVGVDTDSILATGAVNSQAGSGAITFAIPSSFTGTLALELVANNATAEIFTIAETNVSAFVLLLTPSEATYYPGNTISVSVSIQGVESAGVSLIETVTDPEGHILSSGSVAVNGSFQFTVPALATPANVSVVVTAQNQTSGIIASQTLDLYEGDTFVWSAHVATTSSYVDGSFQPGQTIQIAYSLTAMGTAQLPTEFEIVIGGLTAASVPAHVILVQTTASSGQVAMPIPSNAPSGSQLIGVEAVTGPGVAGVYISYVTINIQSDPPVLNYDLGAGFTIAWLVLLLLIIVVAVALIMMMRSRGRGAQPPKPPVQPYNPPSGPSPTGPNVGAWQETSQAEGGQMSPPAGQPPLPPPAS